MNVSSVDADLLDAVVRLVRLAERPNESTVLAPLVVREIVFRLLAGGQGARLGHLLTSGDTRRILLEIVCGSLIILGLLTRLAAIPLIIDMCVALISTKLPILLGHGFWRFGLSKLSSYGFWSMAHEARTDFAMLLGSVFLLIVGAGAWSLDARLAANKLQRDEKTR